MADKRIALNEAMLNGLPKGVFSDLIGAFGEQIGEAKLDKETRDALKEKLGVDEDTAKGWTTAGDVLKIIDTAEIISKHPEVAKKSVNAVLTIVGAFFPVALIGKTFVADLPEETFSKIINILALGDPVHMAHAMTDYAGKKTIQNSAEINQFADNLLAMPERYESTLIIISKDDLLAQTMAQLIEREDDGEEGVVGTKDGSVYVIIANEKFYQKALVGKLSGQKKLFIGSLKSSETLRKMSVTRFDSFGVSYGWAGGDAYIYADPKPLEKKADYEAFLKEISEIDVDKFDKSNARFKMSLISAAKLAFFTPMLLKDYYDYRVRVTRQQLIYGIYKMYISDLDRFLNI